MKDIKIWYLILSAFFYFSTTIEGMEVVSYAIFYLFPLVYILFNLKLLGRLLNACLKSPLKYYLLYTCFLVLGTMLVPVLHDTYDFSYLTGRMMDLPKEILRTLCLAIIFIKHISPEGDYKLFIKYYLLSCCCYVLFTTLLVMFPSLKLMLFEIVKDSEHSRSVALQPDYITRYGWSGFSGFGYTLRCTWGVCLSIFLILDDVKKKNISLYVILGLMLLGNMYYGRSGLMVSAVICMLFVFILLKRRPKMFLVITIVGLCGLAAVIVMVILSEDVRLWFGWAFSIFINFFKTGKLQTESTTTMFEKMIFMPEFKTFFLGDGKYMVKDLYYMNTDVGFMRPMLFGGIGFLLIRYLSVICLIWAFVKHKNMFTGTARRFLILAILIIFVAFEIKGEIVNASSIVLFSIVTVLNYNYYNKTIPREDN